MSYEVVEAAVQTQIRATAEFDVDQVSLGDWRILVGGTTHAAILEYGGYDLEYESEGGGTTFHWRVRVHLYARYAEDAVVHNILRDNRQAIIDRLLQYPRLNNTANVLDQRPVRGEWASPQEVEIGNISFLHEIIEVVIDEVVDVSLAE